MRTTAQLGDRAWHELGEKKCRHKSFSPSVCVEKEHFPSEIVNDLLTITQSCSRVVQNRARQTRPHPSSTGRIQPQLARIDTL